MITVSTITIPTLPSVVAFLEKNEQSHVALMSNLVRNGTPCLPPQNMKYYIVHEENGLFGGGTIRAVISLSTAGNVLHYVEKPEDADDLRGCLSELMAGWKVFCIMGDKAGNRFIRSLIKTKPSHIRDYQLMEYHDSRQLYLPAGTELVTPTLQDANALMLIKKGYYLEEQSLPGGTFYPAAHLKMLQEELTTQQVLTLRTIREEGKPFVAKANTNAVGRQWVQLGGVYTMPAYRGKGYARFLVQQLALSAAAANRKTVLFVKTQNISAQNAYTAAGFTASTPFEISYYTE